MSISEIVTFLGEISLLTGIVLPLILNVKKISNGTRCQLRSEMLRIYYNNREKSIIRQYEYENFVILYEGYKALKGNSFIDKIYCEVQKWEIIT